MSTYKIEYKKMTAISLKIIFVFLIARSNGEQECQEALGMESSLIADGQITASSAWDAHHVPYAARLHLQTSRDIYNGGAWAASANDVNQWLQVDLGLQYNVTRVATQGIHSYPQWVTMYNLQYSDNEVTLLFYKNKQGQTKEFTGNSDSNTVVSHDLNPPIWARYIRFRPLTWNRHISMRVELYSITEEGEKPLGMENGAISDGQITASSFFNAYHKPYLARLHLQAIPRYMGAWAARTNDANQWLLIDLGDQYTNVTRVATQGRQDSAQWVTTYNLQYSDDGATFFYYVDEQGQTKEFAGNTDQNTIVSHELNPPNRVRYIRFRPVTWNNHVSMRVELYGCKQECQKALGIANGVITEVQITASSEWPSDIIINSAANIGRLFYKSYAGAWMARLNDASQWLQVDLGGQQIKVTRVATQGRSECCWVTTYKLQYGNNGVDFHYYKEQGQTTDKVFGGNTDSSTVVSRQLNPPIMARFFRFRPVTWYSRISMRVELYGCKQECRDVLGMENGAISDAQISASSQWDANHAANRGRLHLQEVSAPVVLSGGWLSKTLDVNQWLQIDVLGLGNKYTRVTGVATQGRDSTQYGEQYVTKYKLQYSNDEVNFQYYREHGQTTDKEFTGNDNNGNPVHHDLHPPIRARYIRFRPLTWNHHISMRVELYGCTQECTAPAIGVETGKILDSQLTASSGDPSLARLNGKFAWCPLLQILGEYIQIDLGRLYRVCAVATQGNPGGNKYHLKEYKLGWSNDKLTWETSAEAFAGNTNWRDVVKNFVPVIYARYIRLYPLKWYVRGCVRMEIYGEPWPEVTSALFGPIGSGKALHGHVISSLNDTNAIECMKLCLVTEQCKSFNFSHLLKKCEVSGSTAKAHRLEDQEDFNYYEPPSYRVISP